MKERIAIYRAERFSPNSVSRDRAILEEAAALVGCSKLIHEEEIGSHSGELVNADLILSMARGRETLDLLLQTEAQETIVVNSATAIANCSRSKVDSLLRQNKIPAAPLYGKGGWWIKRGDEAAQSKDDVAFAPDDTEKERIMASFRARGINDIVATQHVEGDLVKFYGVRDTSFFHICYPTDASFSKFGDERRNGEARHTPFCEEALRTDATRLAALTGIYIYGGDCIVRCDGSYAIIDFNDWPSFSPCRKEAAEAIALLVGKL